MTKKSFSLKILLLIGVSLLLLVFVCNSFAAMSAQIMANSKAGYGLGSTGVFIDNTTLSYPIQYTPGSVNREISVQSTTKTTQLVRVKIELYYVNINNIVQPNSTKNVNFVNRMHDWYVVETKDASQEITERYAYLLLDNFNTTQTAQVNLLTGVEFIESTIYSGGTVTIDTSYNSGLYLVIKTTAQSIIKPSGTITTANTWTNAPKAWLDYLNGASTFNLSESSTKIGKTEIYNFRTGANTITYLPGSYRAPVYIRNASNSAVGLQLAVGIVWSNSTQYINNVKLQLKNSEQYYSKSTGGLLDGNGNNYVFFYKLKLDALELIDIMDSFEIINYVWQGQNYKNTDGTPCTLSFSVSAKTVQLTETDFSELSDTPLPEWNWLSGVSASSPISSLQPYSFQGLTSINPIQVGKVANKGSTGGVINKDTYNTPSILENISDKTYTISIKYTPKYYLWWQTSQTITGQYISVYARETYDKSSGITLQSQEFLFPNITAMQTSEEWTRIENKRANGDAFVANVLDYYFIYNGVIAPGDCVNLYNSFSIRDTATVLTATYVEDYISYHYPDLNGWTVDNTYIANLFFVLEPEIEIIEHTETINYTKTFTPFNGQTVNGNIKVTGKVGTTTIGEFNLGAVENYSGTHTQIIAINSWLTFIASHNINYSGEVLNPLKNAGISINNNATSYVSIGVRNNTDTYKNVRIYANAQNANPPYAAIPGATFLYDTTLYQWNSVGGYYEFIAYALAPGEAMQFAKAIKNAAGATYTIKVSMRVELVEAASYQDNREYEEFNSSKLAGLYYRTGGGKSNLKIAIKNKTTKPKNLRITFTKTWFNFATTDNTSSYIFTNPSKWTAGTVTGSSSEFYYNGIFTPGEILNITDEINMTATIYSGALYVTVYVEMVDAFDGNYNTYSFSDWRNTAPSGWKTVMTTLHSAKTLEQLLA